MGTIGNGATGSTGTVGSGSVGKPISNSIRFRSGALAYLNRTPSVAGNRRTWTFSAWIKRGSFNNSLQRFFVGSGTDDFIRFNGDAIEMMFDSAAAAGGPYQIYGPSLYRDINAWYHIVWAVDTTQATASNRVKLYVNGLQVTALTVANYPAQNYQSSIGNNTATFISTGSGGGGYSTELFDGYMSEVHFVDGQQLTPGSFGFFDANNVWRAKTVSVTYGTTGFYLPMSSFATSSGLPTTTGPGFSTYYASFNSSQYISWVPTVASVGTGDYTFECWFRSTNFGAVQTLLGTTNNNGLNIRINNSTEISVDAYNNSASLFTVPTMSINTWYHIAVTRVSGVATVYLNGTRSSSGVVSMGTNYSTVSNRLGTLNSTDNYFLSGDMSNVRYVTGNGNAVYNPNSSTITVPTSALTSVTGTQLLTLKSSTIVDDSTNAYTLTYTGSIVAGTMTDLSGNGNTWSVNNFSLTPYVTYDAMTDAPYPVNSTVGNYATLNPLSKTSTAYLSWANLRLDPTGAGTNAVARSTFPGSGSMKYYVEFTIGTIGSGSSIFHCGIGNEAATTFASGSFTYYRTDGNSDGASVASYTTNDIIGCAVDCGAGTVAWYKNNVLQRTATGLSYDSYWPMMMTASGGSSWGAVNFGQHPYVYTPPSGYGRLQSYNLTEPAIIAGRDYFDTLKWTGINTAASRSITGLGFQPNMVWSKRRNGTNWPNISDAVRGGGYSLYTNSANDEATNNPYGYLSAFNSNGITFSNGASNNSDGNETTGTYAAWCWKESATSGFDIVTYTGNGVDGRDIAHNLGVKPDMIMIKKRTNNSAAGLGNWICQHKSLTAGVNATTSTFRLTSYTNGSIYLNLTNGQSSYGFDHQVNGNTDTFVAYLWSEIPGFSKFGSYTGNGSTDGTFVYCGFKPRFILVKRTDTTGYDWFIYDTVRDAFNPASNYLRPNLFNVEDVGVTYDILSNGFKNRNTFAAINASGATYIFAAFADNPFKYANAF